MVQTNDRSSSGNDARNLVSPDNGVLILIDHQPSWAEHLHEHERVTILDRVIEDHARAFHISHMPPKVSHVISTVGEEI